MCKSDIDRNKILKLCTQFKGLFTRVGKIPLDRKTTLFHCSFKPIQTKGRRVPPHLLENVTTELKRVEKEGTSSNWKNATKIALKAQ